MAAAGDTAGIGKLLAELSATPSAAWADSLLRDAGPSGSVVPDLLESGKSLDTDTTGLRSLLESLSDPQAAAWADSLLKSMPANNRLLEQLLESAAPDAALQSLLDQLNQPEPRPH
jgi:hypothetical protein